MICSGEDWRDAARDDWSAVRIACRSMRTSWRSRLAEIRSAEAEIPTVADEQNLREAGKKLREVREDDRIMRRIWRAGQKLGGREDSPFTTDVAMGQHGEVIAPPLRRQRAQRQSLNENG